MHLCIAKETQGEGSQVDGAQAQDGVVFVDGEWEDVFEGGSKDTSYHAKKLSPGQVKL